RIRPQRRDRVPHGIRDRAGADREGYPAPASGGGDPHHLAGPPARRVPLRSWQVPPQVPALVLVLLRPPTHAGAARGPATGADPASHGPPTDHLRGASWRESW